jgi:hypothetical protein
LRKSKTHHPDRGGDEWAFVIVNRAYEYLSELAEQAAGELSRDSKASTASRRERGTTAGGENGRIRPGLTDKGIEPARVVLVEVVWLRYEASDVLSLIEKAEDRNLSGSVHVRWPDPSHVEAALGHPFASRILAALNASFDDLRGRTAPLTARSQVDRGTFEAWLSYPSGTAAAAAFKVLHVGLKARGLGVRQWTRDLTVPKEGDGVE